MKVILAAAAIGFLSGAAMAQTAPAAAPVAKLTLDTPIEAIVADPRGKVALEATVPGITAHPAYPDFKGMSLRTVQPLSGGQLTDEMMKKIEADLAAIK